VTFGGNLRKRIPVLLVAALLSACQVSIPRDLARAVLLEELGQLDGVRAGFVLCVSVDSVDADAGTLALLRKVYPDVVRGSECQWMMDTSKGSFHRTSGRPAMLVNVFGYKRSGEIEFEARHHGKWGTMKTLQVRHESSGWRVVATLNFMMAAAEQSHAGDARYTRT
jgi:hypothetical protein